MAKPKEKLYGVADRAWQVVVGCSPSMPCAPRCWARKTVARIVECQKPTSPERAAFYQIALTPDGSKWSGEVSLDLDHLNDPLGWKAPAIVATGFHGDWGRLGDGDRDRILDVIARSPHHTFLPLTKEPARVAGWLAHKFGHFTHQYQDNPAKSTSRLLPLDNVNFGCSVMNQQEADKYFPAMAGIAALGWKTHVWYEPAIGPVDWKGWEFLSAIIAGGESGTGARPSHPDWYRRTRDWCEANGRTFVMKQWGSFAPWADHQKPIDSPGRRYVWFDGKVRKRGESNAGLDFRDSAIMEQAPKKVAGCALDGREWKELPADMRVAVPR